MQYNFRIKNNSYLVIVGDLSAIKRDVELDIDNTLHILIAGCKDGRIEAPFKRSDVAALGQNLASQGITLESTLDR